MEILFSYKSVKVLTQKIKDLITEKINAEVSKLHESLKEKKTKGIPKTWDDDKLIVLFDTDTVSVVPSAKTKTTLNFLELAVPKIKTFKVSDVTINKPTIQDTTVSSWVPKNSANASPTKSPKKAQGEKWKTLEHNGVYLGEAYNPSGIGLKLGKSTVKFEADEEELFMLYAKRLEQESNNPDAVKYTTDLVFIKNYAQGLKEYLSKLSFSKIQEYIPKKEEGIKEFNGIFSKMVDFLAKARENPVIDKKAKKISEIQLQRTYKYATVDGRREELDNFKVEPPGLFLGRGLAPKRGCVKPRLRSTNVTLNLSKTAPIPKPNDGRKWAGIVHDNKVSWLAKYEDKCGNKEKYIFLGKTSKIKGEANIKKYEKARKLSMIIDKVEESYKSYMSSKDMKKRQLGTVVYFIDNFAFRIGNEKGADEADTVGASTLKVANVVPVSGTHTITFDFLGKDSIRYVNEKDVDEVAYNNIVAFRKGKDRGELLFDKINSSDVNEYLKTFASYISAKVFRTLRASMKYYDLIKKIPKKLSGEEKLLQEKEVNRAVATLCNHQRKASAASEVSIDKKRALLKEKKKELKDKDITDKKKAAVKAQIKKIEIDIEERSKNLTLACTTSKMNYIDPRIVVSWAKKNDIEIKKIFPVALQKNFAWAIEGTDETWDYEKSEIAVKLTPEKKKGDSKKEGGMKKGDLKKVVKKGESKKPKFTMDAESDEQDLPKEIFIKGKSRLEKNKLAIYEYSEKSYVVFGDTKPIKDKLYELKGKYGTNFMHPETQEKGPGWVFSKKTVKLDELKKVVGNSNVVLIKKEPKIIVPKTTFEEEIVIPTFAKSKKPKPVESKKPKFTMDTESDEQDEVPKKKLATEKPKKKKIVVQTIDFEEEEIVIPTFEDTNDGGCIKNSKVKLRDYQKNFVNYIRNPNHRGAIAAFGVGSGKTLTAVTSIECVLNNNKDWEAIIVTPTSLQENFKKSMVQYGLKKTDKRYKFYTPVTFVNIYEYPEIYAKKLEKKVKRTEKQEQEHFLKIKEHKELLKILNSGKVILVIDEAHNFKTNLHPEINFGQDPDNTRAEVMIECAKKAGKVLLLTATPMYNGLIDVVNLMAMIKGEKELTEGEFNDLIQYDKKSIQDDKSIKKFKHNLENNEEAKEYFECVFAFKDRDPLDKDFPEVEIHNVSIVMEPELYIKYLEEEMRSMKGLKKKSSEDDMVSQAFYNNLRAASVKFEPYQKVNWVVSKIKSLLSEGKKTLVYSSYLDYGIDKIKIALGSNYPSYTITGSTPKAKRQALVDNFNNDEVDLLFITKAGGEGIDLKKVRGIIIFERNWNKGIEEQVIGRGVRYMSHASLPEKDRKVDIYFVDLKKPSKIVREKAISSYNAKVPFSARLKIEDDFGTKKLGNKPVELMTVDEIMKEIGDIKEKTIHVFLDWLHKISIDSKACGKQTKSEDESTTSADDEEPKPKSKKYKTLSKKTKTSSKDEFEKELKPKKSKTSSSDTFEKEPKPKKAKTSSKPKKNKYKTSSEPKKTKSKILSDEEPKPKSKKSKTSSSDESEKETKSTKFKKSKTSSSDSSKKSKTSSEEARNVTKKEHDQLVKYCEEGKALLAKLLIEKYGEKEFLDYGSKYGGYVKCTMTSLKKGPSVLKIMVVKNLVDPTEALWGACKENNVEAVKFLLNDGNANTEGHKSKCLATNRNILALFK